MKDFATILKEIRKSQSLSQKQLGQIIGIGQTTIANYEKGMRFPSPDILMAIADTFNVSIDGLLGREQYVIQSIDDEQYNSHQLLMIQKKLFQLLMDENEVDAIQYITSLQVANNIVNIYEKVLTPVMYKVGEAWHRGIINVAKEHYISGIMHKLVSNISLTLSNNVMNKKLKTLEGDNQGSVICMSLSHEPHTIGIRMITDYFTVLGYKSYFIGANVPTDALYQMMEDINPKIIAISATMDYHLDSLKNIIELIRLKNSNVIIVVGGQAFGNKNNEETVNGDIFAKSFDDLKDGLNNIDK